MIRFCDMEIGCVSYERLDRREILNYLQHYTDEMVCIIDADGRYKGKILYHTLIHCADVYEAISEDYVVLDTDIWKNARRYFSNYKKSYGEHVVFPVVDKMLQLVCCEAISEDDTVLETNIWKNAREYSLSQTNNFQEQVLLPVVDKTGHLVCFAYEDTDANREIRMLQELLETPDALQFSDVYPQYKCVKIYEFNELAYFFAQYLENQGIDVEVVGTKWKGFFVGKEFLGLNYECLTIYAEGVGEKKRIWKDNLLRSVSVEFECIDEIYETNIKDGIIRDAKEDYVTLLEHLKNEKEIILLGAGRDTQNVYNFLRVSGIDVCCFVDERHDEQSHRMFGKRIVSSIEARNTYNNPIFIECISQNSAWGFGGVDYYDYIGYKRNKSFFLLRDYIEVPESNLINVLKSTKIVLTGDSYLCAYLLDYLEKNMISVIGYLDIFLHDGRQQELPGIDIADLDEETMCLITVPEFFGAELKREQEGRKKQIITYLKENGIDNYTDYFSYINSFIKMEESNNTKYTRGHLTPKRIVLGSIEHSCGNVFFKELLDGHPSILMETDWRYLDDKLFWICICLSTETKENILPLFKKMYEVEWNSTLYNQKAFDEKMKLLLTVETERFTSQELFAMIHIAYMYMYGVDIADIQNMIIYWEPHNIPRYILENCVRWLGTEKVSCDIVNIVRNICMRNGSAMKGRIANGCNVGLDVSCFRYIVLNHPSIDKKNFGGSRFVLRFEELKCEPRKILSNLCDKWNIAYSETLMETTCKEKTDYGNLLVKGFDLKPVYNSYEEYFSEFDRVRLMIINAPWQRKYGYPYVEISRFTRRELQEMFSKEFRFEDVIDYSDSETKLDFDIKLSKVIRTKLQKVRMLESFNEI